GASPALPDAATLDGWADQLAMSTAAANGYGDLAPAVWSTYADYASPTFRITTQVLNAYDTQPEQDLPTATSSAAAQWARSRRVAWTSTRCAATSRSTALG
ncbi:hypothetical protein HC891_23985, partial [Candidatus Gracilibacteria bacterium]|nr:hypothetical protein [Candidatus Gracilibacteria bacterium]